MSRWAAGWLISRRYFFAYAAKRDGVNGLESAHARRGSLGASSGSQTS